MLLHVFLRGRVHLESGELEALLFETLDDFTNLQNKDECVSIFRTRHSGMGLSKLYLRDHVGRHQA